MGYCCRCSPHCECRRFRSDPAFPANLQPQRFAHRWPYRLRTDTKERPPAVSGAIPPIYQQEISRTRKNYRGYTSDGIPANESPCLVCLETDFSIGANSCLSYDDGSAPWSADPSPIFHQAKV